MAVQGNTETVNTVLSIDTSKSASSMKELREQIKSLKDQLVGLDQGTQEYQNTVVELGEKMHQLKEINEEVRRTNSDFGDTLGNISNVMAGGVGAVQGLTAGLSLLGVEMGDDNKLTQTLVKSMALLQSLGTMDKAIKSFKALSLVIKSNITAAGGLGKALKALAVSNPFTAILAAATAVVGVVSAIIGKEKELAQAEKDAADAAREQAIEWTKLRAELDKTGDTYTRINDFQKTGLLDQVKYGSELREEIRKIAAEYQNANKGNQQALSTAWMYAFKKAYEDAIAAGNKYKAFLISLSEIEFDIERDGTGRIKETKENYELLARAAALWEKQTKKTTSSSKVERDLEKEKYDLALKRLNLQKTLDDTELTARYEEEKRMAQGNAEMLLAIEEKYQHDRQVLNERYYKNAIALAENFKKTRKKESDIVDVDQTIANLNKSLQEGADAWEAYKIENAEANIELKQSKFEAEENIKSLDRQTAAMEREIEITRQHNERYLELIKQKWTLQADLDAEAIRYQQEQLQNANVGIEDDLTALKTQHEAEMALLQEQYDQKLIADEEFQQKKAELEAQYNNESMSLLQQHFENEAALDELEVEAEKNKLDRKKELNEVYVSAISGILGSINGVLSALDQQEDISFESQKGIKTAMAIMNTFEAATSAYSSMASIPYVGPALGAAAAAAAVAAGLLNVRKIQMTKKDSKNATPSASAVQVVQAPTQMTNITGFSDNITLPDQRVYVLESDITDAQNHVQVVENNSSF